MDGREAGWRVKMEGGGEHTEERRTERKKERQKAFSQHLNRAGLAFRQAARRADGLETQCEAHLGLQSSRLYRSH